MISLLHSAEVCALFPTWLDRLRLVSRTTWCLRNGWPRHSLSDALAPYMWVDRYTYFPLHLLAYHAKISHNLLNYARAHNGMWLHMEVSSMNNLMIPLSLSGIPIGWSHGSPGISLDNTGFPRCPGNPLVSPVCPNKSTQMCIKVATLSFP